MERFDFQRYSVSSRVHDALSLLIPVLLTIIGVLMFG
jgi:hypothetical protein